VIPNAISPTHSVRSRDPVDDVEESAPVAKKRKVKGSVSNPQSLMNDEELFEESHNFKIFQFDSLGQSHPTIGRCLKQYS
jgi:hypothetical protein